MILKLVFYVLYIQYSCHLRDSNEKRRIGIELMKKSQLKTGLTSENRTHEEPQRTYKVMISKLVADKLSRRPTGNNGQSQIANLKFNSLIIMSKVKRDIKIKLVGYPS